eukprot:6837193-Alexandrium_andersonii.AAC.1
MVPPSWPTSYRLQMAAIASYLPAPPPQPSFSKIELFRIRVALGIVDVEVDRGLNSLSSGHL